ncbi:flagellar biosynthesis protein FlhF [Ramlibacter sp. AW1]|uniref:Flagellar biosynthesis protein FlhF n=1 Tax=Ramlibacter aurantiacus TaxID=2801330 RepID=A0A936ZUL1_9BURK|nr:flagellar biosynthesis protein FlhF [Ramlibacter aurantiacus]MBL0421440.1 flagellar biosynthesis protein FlhF [Ramlibacter aurantiacus]
MNVKRFIGRNARDAMAKVRAAWGDDAVVLSNRATHSGVEIMAMPGMPRHSQFGPELEADSQPPSQPAPQASDAMSTLSFERFVRERQQRWTKEEAPAPVPAAAPVARQPQARPFEVPARRAPVEPGRFAAAELQKEMGLVATDTAPTVSDPMPSAATMPASDPPPALGEAVMSELRALRTMINTELSGLSWFDSARRSPLHTRLMRLLIGNGFSPALARHLLKRLPDGDEARGERWLREVITRNLHCVGKDSIVERGGVFALVGPTGVGKTTTTAKIAAGFALRHGAESVGLVTVDTYRMAASAQLRAFGNILGIPVHTARDASSLLDLLKLHERKKLLLVDTVGLGQRDGRIGELLDALPTGRVERLLVLNACAQAETLEEVARNYGARPGQRCVVSKLDEAVKVGPLVDLLVRHRLLVEGIAAGQRVPEDWSAPHARWLVEKALAEPRPSVFTPDESQLALLFTGAGVAMPGAQAGHA